MSDIHILEYKANQKEENSKNKEKTIFDMEEKISMELWKFLTLSDKKNVTQINRKSNEKYKKNVFWEFEIKKYFPHFNQNGNENNFFKFFFHPNEPKKNIFKYLFHNFFVLDHISDHHLPLGFSFNFDVLDKIKKLRICLIGGKK